MPCPSLPCHPRPMPCPSLPCHPRPDRGSMSSARVDTRSWPQGQPPTVEKHIRPQGQPPTEFPQKQCPSGSEPLLANVSRSHCNHSAAGAASHRGEADSAAGAASHQERICPFLSCYPRPLLSPSTSLVTRDLSCHPRPLLSPATLPVTRDPPRHPRPDRGSMPFAAMDKPFK